MQVCGWWPLWPIVAGGSDVVSKHRYRCFSVGAIAIDRSLIPTGAAVQISTLPAPWASKTFRATDIGVGIVGQHIDVFTGAGSAAEQETLRITSENNRVCFK